MESIIKKIKEYIKTRTNGKLVITSIDKVEIYKIINVERMLIRHMYYDDIYLRKHECEHGTRLEFNMLMAKVAGKFVLSNYKESYTNYEKKNEKSINVPLRERLESIFVRFDDQEMEMVVNIRRTQPACYDKPFTVMNIYIPEKSDLF